ncbi:lantibiotic dehydratase C-terminal domain-containing protein [Sphingobacterium sp. JB170]|uniref:lantibiotic dehydratase C-terminal domain-containing protein n=1 Tax=Sphingobacterium sp. JB170 TaxID=1434842 RepID=UPI000B360E7F
MNILSESSFEKVDIDAHYREHKDTLAYFCQHFIIPKKLKKNQVEYFDAVRSYLNSVNTRDVEPRLQTLLHMHLNRLFPHENLQQEAICYFWFYKYYLSVVKKKVTYEC